MNPKIKEYIKQHSDLIDDNSIPDDVKFKRLIVGCPKYLLRELFSVFETAGVSFGENKLIEGITDDATIKEKEFYDFAISLGYVDDYIFFDSHGVAVCNDDVCINIRDNQDGTAYVYAGENKQVGYSDSRKLDVSYRKVKTIIKRGAEGYMIKYMFS